MNARYRDQAKQARILLERLTLNENPITKQADDPLEFESLSPENSPYWIDERDGPGYKPSHIQSKSYPKSESEIDE